MLGEKPVAETVSRALSLAAAAEVTGELFMVSQSRRWNPQLAALREMTARLGRIGTVGTTFFRSERFGGLPRGRTERVDDVLGQARTQALRDETRDDVREAMRAGTSLAPPGRRA